MKDFDPETYDWEGQSLLSMKDVIRPQFGSGTGGTSADCPFCEFESIRSYSASEDACRAVVRHVIDIHRKYAQRLGWRK